MVPIETTAGYCKFTFSDVDWDKYNVRDLIEEIKDVIPWQARNYEADTKSWYVRDEYLHVLADMFGRYFADPAQIDMFSD